MEAEDDGQEQGMVDGSGEQWMEVESGGWKRMVEDRGTEHKTSDAAVTGDREGMAPLC